MICGVVREEPADEDPHLLPHVAHHVLNIILLM